MKTKSINKNVWGLAKKAIFMVAAAAAISTYTASAGDLTVDSEDINPVASTTATYGNITVGSSTGGNVLGIYSASVITTTGVINVGSLSGSVGNVFSLVESDFTSASSFTIGTVVGADGNTVNIINSTATLTGLFRVGFNGSHNAVNIYDSVVTLSGTGHFCIAGNAGAYNKAVIKDSTLKTPRFFVGGMAGNNALTNNNTAFIAGTSTVTISQDLNVGYNSGGTLQTIYGNTFSVFPGSTVYITASGTSAVRVNTFSNSGNLIRIAKSSSTASGAIVWTGDHTSDVSTLITNGAFAYSDNNGASWTAATSSDLSISYSGGVTTINRP